MAHLSPSLAEAVDFFVMRKFVECFDKCCAVIKTAKCEPEHERNQEVIEASAALGIQALAETNLWDHAVSFISDVYGTIDMCPPRIIQVCILLHAHVREYLPCHSLVQHWFENPQNRMNKQCAQVIRIFASHILHPTGCVEALKELVENCPSLSEREKELLLQLPQSGRFNNAERLGATEPLVCPNRIVPSHVGSSVVAQSTDDWSDEFGGEDRTGGDHTTDGEGPERHGDGSLSDVIEYLYHQVTSFLKARLRPWHQRIGLLLMAVFAVLSLMHSQTGDPVSSLGRLVILWKTFLARLLWRGS
ncbi:peroxisome assembly protein 26 [Aplysia californica]|uniref:Peroxisome assembly protein 26 n=1 Tax=Aplysia californica TaxID=6500 RepID=A0ABM0K342_APLCA|nr:peroxisome assembly protein 26 [Aplysia californica]XP_005107660.1 peroxisome assembly protein 26 [Aplysia californica]